MGLGKQPTNEARKINEKLGGAIGWSTDITINTEKNEIIIIILIANHSCHTIVLGTPVSEFFDASKQRVNLIALDPSYRSLCVSFEFQRLSFFAK